MKSKKFINSQALETKVKPLVITQGKNSKNWMIFEHEKIQLILGHSVHL